MLIYLSIGLRPKHLEYIILQLFKTSNNLELLNYYLIFTIFSFESLDFRSPSPSPLRKITTIGEDSFRYNKRTVFKFRSSIEEKNLSNNSKYLYFGQSFVNDLFTTYYLQNLMFNENEEISGNLVYNNEIFQIKGEFQDSVNSLKFITISKEDKKLEFDGLVSNKHAIIKGTLKIAGLEEDLTFSIVTKIWKFEGKYTNNKNTYEFNGYLVFKGSNAVEGKGVDLLGEYSLRGFIERDLQIKLVKSYKDNTRLVFEGLVQREMVVGHYEFEEEEGDWTMKYQEIL